MSSRQVQFTDQGDGSLYEPRRSGRTRSNSSDHFYNRSGDRSWFDTIKHFWKNANDPLSTIPFLDQEVFQLLISLDWSFENKFFFENWKFSLEIFMEMVYNSVRRLRNWIDLAIRSTRIERIKRSTIMTKITSGLGKPGFHIWNYLIAIWHIIAMELGKGNWQKDDLHFVRIFLQV